MDSNTSKEVLNLELYNAAASGCLNIVTELLQQGADPNYQPHYGKWTSLHAACANNHPIVVKALIKRKASVSVRDRIQYTPLHVACMYGYMDCVRAFDGSEYLEGTAVASEFSTSPPLGVALERERLDVVKHLITSFKMSPAGLKDEVLELGCKKNDLDFVKLMMDKFNCDPEKQKKKILGLGCQAGDIKLVETMINKYGCDPKDHLNLFGVDTPMRLAVQFGRLKLVEYLTKHDINPEDCLVIACKADHQGIVEYMLKDCHCDPNVRDNDETPLSHAKSIKVIQLLLKYGAVAEDAYALYKKTLGKVMAKDPLVNPVKMFVVGFQKEGKTTLIQSMQQERKRDALSSIFSSKEITERTPGIVPKVFKSRVFGDVEFFDFAGQEIFYNCHAAFINSSIINCPPIFVLVIGLHRSKTEIGVSVSKWMVLLKNHCAQINGKAPLVVVGSHLDELKGNVTEREHFILECIAPFESFFKSTDFIAMDCRQCNSPGIKQLRELICKRCEKIREQLSVNLNSHMFLLFLLEHYSEEVFVPLKEACQKIETDDKSKKGEQIVPFIPTTYIHLIPICQQLNDNGHIFFILNSNSPENSSIIVNKAKLLTIINGTIFSPENFREYKRVASSAGIIAKSKLEQALPKFNVDMIVEFMIRLDLAIPIKDEMILIHLDNSLECKEQYFFCPALISSKPMQGIWEPDESYRYYFGWVVRCMKEGQLFDNRFMEVLLLRLASFVQVVKYNDINISFNCLIWKMGICWTSSVGANIVVEVNPEEIFLRIRFRSLDIKCLQLRATVMSKIRATLKDLCSSVVTSEGFVNNKDLGVIQYNQETQISAVDITNLAESVVKIHSSVSSLHSLINISCLVGGDSAEVYANLGVEVLCAFFKNNCITKTISNAFFKAFSFRLLKFPEQANVILSAISSNKLGQRKSPTLSCPLYVALLSWSKDNVRTYQDLKHVLDNLSVFGGLNLLELAKEDCEPFSEKELPVLDDTQLESDSLQSNGYTSRSRGSLPAQFSHESSYHSYRSASLSSESSVFIDPEESFRIDRFDVSSPFSSLKSGTGTRGSSTGCDTLIESLCEKYAIGDSQLDQRIDLQNIQLIAACFDYVDLYLDKLGLTPSEQTDIKDLQFRRNTQIAVAELLKIWYSRNPLANTYRFLLSSVLELKSGDVAKKICEFIVDKVTVPIITEQAFVNGNKVKVEAYGGTSVLYKWLKDGKELSDGENYNGSTTPELCIVGMSLQVLGNYQCKVTNECGETVSEAVLFGFDSLVKDALWDIRPNWYLFGIQLDIDHSKLEEIRTSTVSVPTKYMAVLESFSKNENPLPTLTKLIEALQSFSIHRLDLIKKLHDSIPDTCTQEMVSAEIKTPAVRLRKLVNALWELRADWTNIADSLPSISPATRKSIQMDYNDTDKCFAAFLHEHLTNEDPGLKCLLEALRSNVVGREDVAKNLEGKIQSGQLW